ncbi:HVO_2523 family zinc finger protein [Halorubrum sp. DTA98]|uniref:HVO_2523 family zinc finger protein n=1 Tax=Halorubrum sp. DTA98 TaxID=3402163 RepID=UPI003AB033A4
MGDASGPDGGSEVDERGDAGTDTEDDDETDTEDDAESRRPTGRPCPLCGASMFHRHCKYVCPAHGVVYDCSDTFY